MGEKGPRAEGRGPGEEPRRIDVVLRLAYIFWWLACVLWIAYMFVIIFVKTDVPYPMRWICAYVLGLWFAWHTSRYARAQSYEAILEIEEAKAAAERVQRIMEERRDATPGGESRRAGES